MTEQEKKLFIKEIKKYIKDNCYYKDKYVKYDDLWLVGWVVGEFENKKEAMRLLINNEYGLLGNLINKYLRDPDKSIEKFIEQADLAVILEAIEYGGNVTLSKNELTSDPYAMRLLIEHDDKYAGDISGSLLGSKSFLLSAVARYPEILQKAYINIFKDEEFVYSLIKKNYACLKYLPNRFYNNYRICFEAVGQEGYSIMYFNYDLRKKDEIVLRAVSNRGKALSFASLSHKKNREIVSVAVKNCGLALEYADDSFKSDYEIVALAVGSRGLALKYASPELKDCYEIVKIAVENDGYAISLASLRLRDDYDLAVKAIASYTDAYKYLSIRLQSDPKIQEMYFSKKEEENKWLLSRMQ